MVGESKMKCIDCIVVDYFLSRPVMSCGAFGAIPGICEAKECMKRED